MTFSWAAATHRGRVRPHNEDSLWPRPEGEDVAHGEAADSLLAAVADGMGGHVGGEIASGLAIETAIGADGDPVARVQAANAAVFDASRRRPRLAGMGTTLTLASFAGRSLSIGHIGDSRAYLLRDGSLEQLTRDHSLVAEMVAAGELRPEEVPAHPFRSVITRALGMDDTVEVDPVHRELRPGDRILLCSDGLTTMLDDGEITALLDGPDGADAVAALIEEANRAGGVDNISVVVVDVGS